MERGLCAVHESQFMQVLVREPGENNHREIWKADEGHELDEHFESRHIGQIKSERVFRPKVCASRLRIVALIPKYAMGTNQTRGKEVLAGYSPWATTHSFPNP